MARLFPVRLCARSLHQRGRAQFFPAVRRERLSGEPESAAGVCRTRGVFPAVQAGFAGTPPKADSPSPNGGKGPVRPGIQRLRIQVLVIAGTNDMIREEHTRSIGRALFWGQVKILPGDHFLARKNSQPFNEAVLEFLTKEE